MAIKKKNRNLGDSLLVGLGCLAGLFAVPVMMIVAGIASKLIGDGPDKFEKKMAEARIKQKKELVRRVSVLARILEENSEKFIGFKYELDIPYGSFYNTGASFQKIVNPEIEPDIDYCDLHYFRRDNRDEKGKKWMYVRPSCTYGEENCMIETTSDLIALSLLERSKLSFSELVDEIRKRTGRDLEQEIYAESLS